jgi:hypothetical protein
MEIEKILKLTIDELEKLSNMNLIEIFNFLADNIELVQKELKELADSIQNEPIEDDFFRMNIKKQEYKNKGLILLNSHNSYMDMQNKIFKILTKRTGNL